MTCTMISALILFSCLLFQFSLGLFLFKFYYIYCMFANVSNQLFLDFFLYLNRCFGPKWTRCIEDLVPIIKFNRKLFKLGYCKWFMRTNRSCLWQFNSSKSNSIVSSFDLIQDWIEPCFRINLQFFFVFEN